MAHKRAAIGFHSIPAIDNKSKRTKVHDDEMEISSDDVFYNILSRLPVNTLMRFRCVSIPFNALISRFLDKLISHTNIKPKRKKMEISDEILCNILSRLPPNPLMRFRCVSMHWNSLISDSYFINSRSHPKILLPGPRLHVLDNKTHSITYLPFPIKNRRKRRGIIILGTFNGIVVLFRRNGYDTNKFVLYNPLTGATKKLPDPPYPCCNLPQNYNIYGFGYGDDPKIIIGHTYCSCRHSRRHFSEVFSLKKGTWTRALTMFGNRFFPKSVGVFLNGFLHWFCTDTPKWYVFVLDVKNIVVSNLNAPLLSDGYRSYGLGALYERLCLIEPICHGFNLWVMKEHGVSDTWSKEYSFTLALEYDYKRLHTVCILEDGRIVVMDGPYRIVVCDPSKDAYNVFTNTDRMFMYGNGIEYVESLASPSNLCNF